MKKPSQKIEEREKQKIEVMLEKERKREKKGREDVNYRNVK